MIDITLYNDKHNDLYRLQQNILEQLGEFVFVPTYPILCFHILRCISYPNNSSLKLDEASIEIGCFEVKAIFEKQFDYWVSDNPNIKNSSIFEQFALNLADLENLPGLQLIYLEDLVKKDLAKRVQSIEKYEEDDFIRKHKSDGEQPRDHNQRTLLAFYNRNLEEQQEIIRYLLNEVKPRALTKSRNYFSITLGMFQTWGDRLYHTAVPFSERYFDHDKIDRVSHRLLAISIKDADVLRALYDVDRKKFYQEVFQFQPLDYVLNNIKYHISMLHPHIEPRQKLFEEMLELYETKKYYGFYSLSLSQVEGLFSEMLAKYGSTVKKAKALPDKVKALRNTFDNNVSTFDYYEFYIPLQRNKFMHTGIDGEVETKAHDLLFDLMDVLQIYASLDAPVVLLTQAIKKREPDEYLNEKGFNRYFKLLEASATNKSDFSALEGERKSFEEDFLTSQLTDNAILLETATLIPQTLNNLKNIVKIFTGFNGKQEVNLDDWTMQRIHSEKSTMVEELGAVYNAHTEIFEKLDGYLFFLTQLPERLTKISKAERQSIKEQLYLYKNNLNRIKRIGELIRESHV